MIVSTSGTGKNMEKLLSVDEVAGVLGKQPSAPSTPSEGRDLEVAKGLSGLALDGNAAKLPKSD